MMAVNRLRLRHRAGQGDRMARLTQTLLGSTDKLLAFILLGNTLLNAGATALVTALAIHYFGGRQSTLLIATGVVSFLILVFAELTPKVIGATYPDRLAPPSGFVLAPLIKLFSPAIFIINLFVRGLLAIFHVPRKSGSDTQRLTPAELRTAVLEGAGGIPAKHRSILLNVFDLEEVTVDDLMTPRARVEVLDISQSNEAIRRQLVTCYHNKLPVIDGDMSRVLGVLQVRKLVALADAHSLTAEYVREVLVKPYFVPSGTPILQQLQMFQDNQRRQGLVVDEYGETLGLITLEDIVEEIVGEFTTQAPGLSMRGLRWDRAGQAIVDGSTPLRELNRRLGLHLPLDGPRTLNGLILETLQEFPNGLCCIRAQDCYIEAMQIVDQTVRRVRLIRRTEGETPAKL
jgi:Mg2+/Co2+ transporter CorB